MKIVPGAGLGFCAIRIIGLGWAHSLPAPASKGLTLMTDACEHVHCKRRLTCK
jgi:hypothetical protein